MILLTLVVSNQAAEEHLKKVVLDASQKTLTDLISEPPQLENLLKSEMASLRLLI